MVLVGVSFCICGQAQKKATKKESIFEAHERPKRVVNYSGATKLKITTRKTTYTKGELFSIDFALINMSDRPLFVLNNLSSNPADRLEVQTENGTKVRVTPSEVYSLIVRPKDFVVLKPKEIVTGSIFLLAGCDDEALSKFDKSRLDFLKEVAEGRTAYHQGTFDRALFANWGDACIDSKTSALTVQMSATNKFVFNPVDAPSVQTAVGSIRTNVLNLTIR